MAAYHETRMDEVTLFLDSLPVPYKNYTDEGLKRVISNVNTHLHKKIKSKEKTKKTV